MIINYLVIGVLWALILEWINTISIEDIEDISLDVKDRVIIVLIWPISLIIFIVHLIKRFNEKN
jgi:hypothetical protein